LNIREHSIFGREKCIGALRCYAPPYLEKIKINSKKGLKN
jgi:hypothetical protein